MTVAATAAPTRSLSRQALLNRPVSGREVSLRDGESIVSRTDPRGVIQYINGYFVEVSGYSEAELLGQPHNLIRHPDMPAAAFADMWANLKQGRPRVGMVKNRCKNGDHYWVRAHVTPIVDAQGATTGYLSVRRKPSREQVAEAERDYAAMRAGSLRDVVVRNGRVLRVPLLERLNPLWKLNLTTRLYLFALLVPGLALALLWRAGAVPDGGGWALLGAGTLFALYSAWWLSRDVVGRLGKAGEALRDIAGDVFTSEIDTARRDEVGRVLLGLKAMQTRLGFQVEEMRREGRAMRRITEALDVAATNIMVANGNLAVVFANRALRDTFRRGEDAVARAVPGFRADALVGDQVERFLGEPAEQRALLASLRAPHAMRRVMDRLTFDVLVTPVLDDRQKPIGYVVEWRDRTDELQIEREVEQVVERASHGELTLRIGEQGKQGHHLMLARGINAVLGNIASAVGEIRKVLGALAQGDLTRRVEAQLEGEFGEMAANANDTVDSLAAIVAQIQDAVGVISTAASEIAAGNADLAQRTEQQAANLEETASSMEELTSTVQNNAQSARNARQLAEGASAIAQRGGSVVEGAVGTMSRITQASKQIEEIITVIDGIAFQTNILALNAAVEAARAGEQGRGFAVVASEVRALAQRSATSAKEIKALIGASVQAVDEGARQVHEAGTAIGELVGEVGKVSGLVSEISAATDEQAAGIGVVNQTVAHLDSTTQQNAALVEQASAAARSMEDQARALAEAVARFRVRR
jgi:methyl-accepting chemotaxis protein